MKNLKVSLLILMSNLIFAQKNYFDHYEIKAIGLSDGYYLEGGGYDYLQFNSVDLKKTPSPDLPVFKELDYEKILNGGLNSFLFENKYYDDLSYYSLFGWGNFSVMNKDVLEMANELFFPNRKILNSVYAYYAPEYKKAFTKLTVQEQQLYLSKLDISEKFVKYVLQGKNRAKYDAWLAKNKLENDRYITEFMERRVKKGHWKIADCYYWINKVKKDFEPLKKNEKIAANYYYIQEQVGDSLYLVMDHKCNLFFTDKQFNRCDDNTYESVTFSEGEFFGKKKNSRKIKIKPVYYDENNIQYAQLGDSICVFMSGKKYKYMGKEWNYRGDEMIEEDVEMSFESAVLYDFKNKRIFRDSIIFDDLSYYGDKPLFSFYTLEKDSLGIIRKSDNQVMFGPFHLSGNKMPDCLMTIDAETFEEINYFVFDTIEYWDKIVAFYYSIGTHTILLDFEKGTMKEFLGRGRFEQDLFEYHFVKN
jgi:hypothetical protein